MIRLEPRQATPLWLNLSLPLVAIAATLILCSGLILLAGTGFFTYAIANGRRGVICRRNGTGVYITK